jgi:hypothetical protein
VRHGTQISVNFEGFLGWEMGFDLPRYQGGNRWHVLVRDKRSVEKIEFMSCRINTPFEHGLINADFVANVA